MALNDSPVALATCLMSDTRLSGTFTVKTTFRSGTATVCFILSASSMYRYACLLETSNRSMITDKASSFEEPSLNKERTALSRSASSACGDLLLMCHNYTTSCVISQVLFFIPIPCISYCLFKLKVIYCVGGVISPLLANIYLNVLDKLWKVKKVEERMEARLIRYADDLVVMCRGNSERILKGTRAILEKLGLRLNEEKTRVVNTWKERFDFLGFTVEMAKSPRTGKKFPLIRPSKKAMAQIQAKIKSLTCRRTLALPKVIIIQKLNEAVRGWVGYFYYGNCSRNMATTKRFLEERVRIYLRRKQAKKNRGYRQYPNQYLYANLHLYKIPTTAPWTQTAKASGRR